MTTPSRRDHFITIDHRRLHCVEFAGPPPALVFLHGLAMSWAVWQGTTRRFAGQHRLLLPDLRGHGESDHLPPSTDAADRSYYPPGFAGDIVQLLDQLDVSDAVLVGSSLGGLVSVVVAARSPERVAGICLVDPPLDRIKDPDRKAFRELLAAKPHGVEAIARVLAPGAPGVEAAWLRPMARMVEQADPRVLQAAERDGPEYSDLSDWYPRVRCPVVIMRADPQHGGVLDTSAAERAVRSLREAEIVEFPGAGHAIHASQPQQFALTLQRFIASVSGSQRTA